MNAHTPTPWALGKGYGLHGVEIVGNSGNRMVCGVISVDRHVRDRDGRVVGAESDTEGAANAAFIVRACNAHDDLVAALSAYDTALRYAWESGRLPASVIPAELAQQARDALAKAGAA